MEKETKGRGRARGRTSRPPTHELAAAEHRGRGPPGEQPPARPGPSREAFPVVGAVGRANTRQPQVLPGAGPAKDVDPNGGNGNGGNGNGSVGRGALRGKRVLQPEIIHTRPDHVQSKQGVHGRPINLMSNYFEMRSITNWVLYQHHVNFAPVEDRTGVRKALMKVHKDTIGGYLFDGMILYTSHRLPGNPMELFSTRQGDDTQVRITVTFSRQLNQGDHEYLQFFNILMRKCLGALKLQLVGRNYFDPIAKVNIHQYKMELWPGYTTSIRQHETHIMMNVEITHKVMRQETVLDLLKAIQQNSREFQVAFKTAVLGLVVLTDYNNRTYRIDDVDFSVTPQSSFKLKNQEDITYCKYYFDRYRIKLNNLVQPLLVSKSKARDLRAGVPETVYLIPELCRMTGLTDDMRNNFNLMRALADHTRVGPDVRVDKLINFSRRLMNEQAIVEDLEQWNMKIAPALATFQARVLPSETIIQGQANREIQYDSGPRVDWTSNLRSNPMLNIANLTAWIVMCPSQHCRDASNFIGLVIKAAQGMKMQVVHPRIHEIHDDRQGTYVNELEEVLSSEAPQIVVCIVSNNRGDRYGAIKKKCCVDRAVPTQVITTKCFSNKGAMSIATKIAIQINCKVGGAPWTVSMPLKGMMIVGFDVSHDTMNKGLSYGAVVASLNNNCSRYFSAVSSHKSGEELSNDLSINLIKALQKYRECNEGSLPSRIFIYRDGVGDGQIPYVYNHEVALLKDKLAQLYSGQDYKLAFIIVSKRINTRFFTKGPRKPENPPPGTVVDSCVTLPERYDFFIVSQSVRQGTVSPTSYNVISDSTGLNPDKMQRFTYKLTHLYYNWSGTVRVPAPVQYAHKLAMLVGQALHRAPHNDLDNLLYYL